MVFAERIRLSFAGFGLLLLNIVGEIGESLELCKRNCNLRHQRYLTSSPFRRSCGVCFIRVAMSELVLLGVSIQK